jgi:hypothetical protein
MGKECADRLLKKVKGLNNWFKNAVRASFVTGLAKHHKNVKTNQFILRYIAMII